MKPLFPQNYNPNPASLPGLSSSNPWEILLGAISDYISQDAFNLYIKPLNPVINQDKIVLFAPNTEVYLAVINNYFEIIQQCKLHLGAPFTAIQVELLHNLNHHNENLTDKEQFFLPSARKNPELGESLPTLDIDEVQISDKNDSDFSLTLTKTSKLNPIYTFDNFVKGPSNEFALATCLNVAENLGQNYNPLFLYGPTGLGKTHLLHAVGNAILAKNNAAIVTYISSERFMNEMIYCIRHNKMWFFRQKYRHCDLFLMDDIQFISGNKAATQEEFFHTFNTLYEAKKQIIVTSDLFPQEIPDIEERLRNRFQWGLVADIQAPDMEHRIAILMNKSENLSLNLPYEVAEFLATQAKKNIRELEGALHRISAFSTLQGKPLDLNLAKELFQHTTKEIKKKVLNPETIQKIVAGYFKIKLSDLKSDKRVRLVSQPRQIAMYLVRNYTGFSYPEIGERFGGKDHTTVMHAVKKIEREKKIDRFLKTHLDFLENQLDGIM
jgi:chromosomal replication initiator protein